MSKSNETKSKRVIKPSEMRAFNALTKLLVNNAEALRKHKRVVESARDLHEALKNAVRLDNCPL